MHMAGRRPQSTPLTLASPRKSPLQTTSQCRSFSELLPPQQLSLHRHPSPHAPPSTHDAPPCAAPPQRQWFVPLLSSLRAPPAPATPADRHGARPPVAPRLAQRRSRPPHARRAQERRDPQRTPRPVRHVDEPHPQGGGPDEPGAWRHPCGPCPMNSPPIAIGARQTSMKRMAGEALP